MPSALKLWERGALDKANKKETEKAHTAFLAYRDMGPGRSAQKVASRLSKSECLLRRWSSRWSWVLRARAWDRHLQAQQDAKVVEITVSLREELELESRETAKWLSRRTDRDRQVVDAIREAAIRMLHEGKEKGDHALVERGIRAAVEQAKLAAHLRTVTIVQEQYAPPEPTATEAAYTPGIVIEIGPAPDSDRPEGPAVGGSSKPEALQIVGGGPTDGEDIPGRDGATTKGGGKTGSKARAKTDRSR